MDQHTDDVLVNLAFRSPEGAPSPPDSRMPVNGVDNFRELQILMTVLLPGDRSLRHANLYRGSPGRNCTSLGI